MSSLIIGAPRLGAIPERASAGSLAQWATRILLCGLAIFAVSIPHSIAAAQIGLGLSYVAWIARALAVGRLGIPTTPIDRPLLCFIALTIVSSVLSVEPADSIPKLRTLTLFGVFYLIIANLRPRGARWIIGLMIVSGLAGVGYSFMEKGLGRGMIITTIDDNSPLRTSYLQPGDVIWMIGRSRVNSLEEANRIIRESPAGATYTIEALRCGDPAPAPLSITDEMKSRANPLGINASGHSRRFRISGFSRHFITYAEQMQLFALLAYGLLLINLKALRKGRSRAWLWVSLSLAGMFSLALILTASRGAIASCILALLVTLALIKERRAMLLALVAVVAMAAVSVQMLPAIRTQQVTSLTDDSSKRRFDYMRAGLRLIPHHPIFGVGMDSQKYHWKEWGFPGDYITHTHSTPIQIAVDRGLPALGCYLWLMAMLFVMTWRAYKKSLPAADKAGSGLMLGVIAALIGFSASSLINYNFGDSEPLLMLLSVVALSLVANANFEPQSAQRAQRAE
jgi:O-antigen ligase/polysaccharide polymerase Wzy-like membrane protein/PDZ domain-containing protein